LTDEQGPAHKKTFYVTLSLGNEEYKSEGQSIKKAQHAAATEALELTKYPRPPAKQQLRNEKTVHTGGMLDVLTSNIYSNISDTYDYFG